MKSSIIFEQIFVEASKYSNDLLDWLTKRYFLKILLKGKDYMALSTFVESKINDLVLDTKQELIRSFLSDFPDASKSAFKKDEYLKSIIGFMLVYYIWLRNEDEQELIEKFDDIFMSGILGTLGYGIIDAYCDNRIVSDQNIYLSLQLISMYEYKLINCFGFSKGNLDLLQKLKLILNKTEYLEKSLFLKKSPYKKGFISECGNKASHLFFPLGLLLLRMGVKEDIDIYLRVYLNCAAVIQVIDDIGDVEEDLQNGHYSFPIMLLNQDNAQYTHLSKKDIIGNRELMLQIKANLLETIKVSEELIEQYNIPIFPFAYINQAVKARVLIII